MLSIRNVIYTKCYLYEMLPIRNVTYTKCTIRNVTIRKCTIRNVTDPLAATLGTPACSCRSTQPLANSSPSAWKGPLGKHLTPNFSDFLERSPAIRAQSQSPLRLQYMGYNCQYDILGGNTWYSKFTMIFQVEIHGIVMVNMIF